MSKRGTIQQKYSAEFKIGVIMDMREHRMGYRETVRKYWDVTKGQEHNYHKQVQRWERIALHYVPMEFVQHPVAQIQNRDMEQKNLGIIEISTWMK